MVTYHDPHDYAESDHLLEYFHAENPTLADLYDPLLQHTFSPIPVSSNVAGEPSYPIQGSDMAAASPSNTHGESSGAKENFFVGNGTVLSTSSVPSEPFNCSCCHLLRAITHTNGEQKWLLGFNSNSVVHKKKKKNH